MKTLKILISAICMIFGQEDNSTINKSLGFQQTCELSNVQIPIQEIEYPEIADSQLAEIFYTGEDKTSVKENTIMSIEEGHFYLAEGFWKNFSTHTDKQEDLLFIAQKN